MGNNVERSKEKFNLNLEVSLSHNLKGISYKTEPGTEGLGSNKH